MVSLEGIFMNAEVQSRELKWIDVGGNKGTMRRVACKIYS